MTTAANTSHSPVLMLRAAPISRLWMLRPADSTNRRPMKQRKIGHPCTGRNDTNAEANSRHSVDVFELSLSCSVNGWFCQALKHSVMKLAPLPSTTRSTYQCKQRKMFERQDRTSSRTYFWGMQCISHSSMKSYKQLNNHQQPLSDFCTAARLFRWPKLRTKHHTSTQSARLGTMESTVMYVYYLYKFGWLPMLRSSSFFAKVRTWWTMSHCAMSNTNLPQKQVSTQE